MLGEGKQPTLYYLCIGQMPADLVDEKVKFNLPIYILNILSVTCHSFVSGHFMLLRLVKMFKKQGNIISTATASLLNKINKESLFRSVIVF
jgi:hypothetical protein